jgi:hypothetical protein
MVEVGGWNVLLTKRNSIPQHAGTSDLYMYDRWALLLHDVAVQSRFWQLRLEEVVPTHGMIHKSRLSSDTVEREREK